MPWTYTAEPFAYPATAASLRDTVRFLTGDTNSSDQQLQDGEIAGLLTQNSSDPYQASIEGCRALSAKYSRDVNKSIGDASVDAAERAQHYRDLAKDLVRQSLRHGGAPTIYAGGISQSDMETDIDDDDRVTPQFSVGMNDDPGDSSLDMNNGTGFTQVVPG